MDPLENRATPTNENDEMEEVVGTGPSITNRLEIDEAMKLSHAVDNQQGITVANLLLKALNISPDSEEAKQLKSNFGRRLLSLFLVKGNVTYKRVLCDISKKDSTFGKINKGHNWVYPTVKNKN